MHDEIHDLRDPLSGPAASHPGTLALPSTLLSWGSGLAAVLVLATLDLRPAWQPSPPLALVAALLGFLLAAAVAWAGHRRAGPVFPRLWILLLAAACLLASGLLAAGPQALRPALRGPALALFAAAAALLPRLHRRRLVPHHRRLASIGLLGPILGVAFACALRLAGGMADGLVDTAQEPKGSQVDMAGLCRELEHAWRGDLEPLARSASKERLAELAGLEARLAATPPEKPPEKPPGKRPRPPASGSAGQAACAGAAATLEAALDRAPTPSSLAVPAFEHPPRPEGAGELKPELPRDPEPACRLYRSLGATIRALDKRLADNEARLGLRRALEARRLSLTGHWLDGWLLPCLDGGDLSEAAPATTIADPPGLEGGRPDRWLRLTLREARELAVREQACALRPVHEDRQRRWQAFDCVLLRPRRGELAILGELGLVYASRPRKPGEETLPTIAEASPPATLRLLLDDDAEGDVHRRAVNALRALEPALVAAGARFDPPPGNDAGDSSAWRFGLRFDNGPGAASNRLEGTISRRILPGGREGVLFVLRRAEDAS